MIYVTLIGTQPFPDGFRHRLRANNARQISPFNEPPDFVVLCVVCVAMNDTHTHTHSHSPGRTPSRAYTHEHTPKTSLAYFDSAQQAYTNLTSTKCVREQHTHTTTQHKKNMSADASRARAVRDNSAYIAVVVVYVYSCARAASSRKSVASFGQRSNSIRISPRVPFRPPNTANKSRARPTLDARARSTCAFNRSPRRCKHCAPRWW